MKSWTDRRTVAAMGMVQELQMIQPRETLFVPHPSGDAFICKKKQQRDPIFFLLVWGFYHRLKWFFIHVAIPEVASGAWRVCSWFSGWEWCRCHRTRTHRSAYFFLMTSGKIYFCHTLFLLLAGYDKRKCDNPYGSGLGNNSSTHR